MPKKTKKKSSKSSKIKISKVTFAQAESAFRAQELAKREKQKNQRKKSREYRQVKKAVASFRARKSDRESFQFISTEGKRLPAGSRRKGIFVYVSRTGKKQVVHAGKTHDLKFKRQSSFDLQRAGKKRAFKRYYADSAKVGESPAFRSRSRSGVDLAKVADSLATSLKRVSRSRADETFIVSGIVFVEGQRRSIDFQFKFSRRFSQKRINYRGFARAKLFFAVGHELDLRNIVSKQSAAYIQKLSVNRKKKRKDWQQQKRSKKGEVVGLQPWQRKDNAVKKIKSVEYKISRVIIRSTE